eukprot:5983867-Prorocentrum_lima.AAC.1
MGAVDGTMCVDLVDRGCFFFRMELGTGNGPSRWGGVASGRENVEWVQDTVLRVGWVGNGRGTGVGGGAGELGGV